MPVKTHILIIGAGPVGLTAAVELKRRGFDPMIIDNDGVPTPESRALAIHARTLDILEPAGVTERLIAAGNKIKHMKIRQNGTTRLKLDFADLPHRFPFILTLPQSKTEEILIERLGELGTDVHWHHTLKTVEKSNGGFNCTIQAEGKAITVKTDLLIGADGTHSVVRKSLGFSFEGESVAGEWSLADIKLKHWPHPYDTAVANIDNDVVKGFFPMEDGYGRFVSASGNITENLPDGAEINDVVWESGFRVSYRQVGTYQKGNAFLAGDAAHIHSPMGGRGMNLGIEDAAFLAWLIETGQTDQYNHHRHETGKKLLKFTKQQTEMLINGGKKRDFIIRYLAPIALAFKSVRKKALTTLTGLDTPAPPWL